MPDQSQLWESSLRSFSGVRPRPRKRSPPAISHPASSWEWRKSWWAQLSMSPSLPETNSGITTSTAGIRRPAARGTRRAYRCLSRRRTRTSASKSTGKPDGDARPNRDLVGERSAMHGTGGHVRELSITAWSIFMTTVALVQSDGVFHAGLLPICLVAR